MNQIPTSIVYPQFQACVKMKPTSIVYLQFQAFVKMKQPYKHSFLLVLSLCKNETCEHGFVPMSSSLKMK